MEKKLHTDFWLASKNAFKLFVSTLTLQCLLLRFPTSPSLVFHPRKRNIFSLRGPFSHRTNIYGSGIRHIKALWIHIVRAKKCFSLIEGQFFSSIVSAETEELIFLAWGGPGVLCYSVLVPRFFPSQLNTY